MLFLLLHEHQLIKSLLPFVVAAGTLPPFVIFWTIIRIITLILPRNVYRKSDDYLFRMFQNQNMFLLENLTGIKLLLYGDYNSFFNDKKSYIMVSNHQCNFDYVIVNMLAARQGSLGHLRYLVRDKIRYWPFFGFYFQLHGCFYRRKNANEMQRLKTYFSKLAMPSSVVLFPEGKKFNKNDKELIAMSHKYAAECELPLLQYVLLPKVKETFTAISQLQEKIDNIYDVTIAYNDTPTSCYDFECTDTLEQPSIRDLIRGKSIEAHVHLNKISIKDIATNNGIEEKNFASWLISLFEKKDKMLEGFHSFINKEQINGLERRSVNSLSLFQTLPSLFLFSASTIFMLSSAIGRKVYFNSILYASLLSILYMKLKRNNK